MFTQKLQIALIVILILVVGIGGFFYAEGQKGEGPMATSTPQAPSNETMTLGLGQTGTAGGLDITPVSVVEDSRCPTDVQCIWAGRIRISVALENPSGSTTQELSPGDTVTVGGQTVMLVSADPARVSTHAISAADYRFAFTVTSADAR